MHKFRNKLLRHFGAPALTASLLCVAGVSSAQAPGDETLAEMRRSIEVFSGVLRESLGFNERRGVFSPLPGDVQGHYLAGQGVMLEMITPLRSYRSSASLQSLNSSLQDLSAQLGSLMERGVVARPDFAAMRETMALSLRSDELAQFYREQMEQLASRIDTNSVEQALQMAHASLQGLRNLGELEPETVAGLSEQMQTLREQLAARVTEIEALRQEIREQVQLAADELPDAELQQRWQQARERLSTEVAALQAQAAEQAATLQARESRVEIQRLAQWQQEVGAFEDQIYQVLCDYASGLRTLPEDERLTVLLTGLGAVTDDGQRRDRIHVFTRADLMACQRGDLDVAGLRNRAVSYDF